MLAPDPALPPRSDPVVNRPHPGVTVASLAVARGRVGVARVASTNQNRAISNPSSSRHFSIDTLHQRSVHGGPRPTALVACIATPVALHAEAQHGASRCILGDYELPPNAGARSSFGGGCLHMHTSMSTNPLWQRLHWLGCIEAESAFVSQGGGMDADVHSPKRHGSRSPIGTSVTFGPPTILLYKCLRSQLSIRSAPP